MEQIDEMVTIGQYANALDLLEILDQAVLPDKVSSISARYTSGPTSVRFRSKGGRESGL